jgi:hypothetical protein
MRHPVAKRLRSKLIAIRKPLNTTCRCLNTPGVEFAIERGDLTFH